MQPLQTRVLQTIEAHSARVESSSREDETQMEGSQVMEGSVRFFQRRETADIILSEARKVLAALRRNPRFAQPGTTDLPNGSVYLLGSTFGGVSRNGDETRLVRNVKLLRNAFASESWPKDSRSVFKPFIDLLRTEDLPGSIISTVLSSLNRMIVYRVPSLLVKLSGNPCVEDAEKSVEDIVETVSALRFGGFDLSTDDVILSRMCELLSHCVNSPEGEYLSNETLVRCIETFLRACSPRGKKRSECSRKVAESYLRTVISHVFSRASDLIHEGTMEYHNMKEAKPFDSLHSIKEDEALVKQHRNTVASEDKSTYTNPPHIRYNYRSLAWFLSLGARMVDPVITQNVEERLIGLQLLEIALHSAPEGSLTRMLSLRRILLRDVCRALLRCLGTLNDPSPVIASSFSSVLSLINTLGPYSTPLVQMILIRIAHSFLFKEEYDDGNGHNNLHITISPVSREIALDSLAALLQRQGFLSAAYAVLDCQLSESDAVEPLLEALSEETVLTSEGKLSPSGRIVFEIFLACMDTLATRSFAPSDSDIDSIYGCVRRIPDICIEQMRAKKRLKKRVDELVKEFNSVGSSTNGMQVIDLIRKRDLLAQVSICNSPKSASSSPPASPSRFSPSSPILSSFHEVDATKAAASFLRFTPGLNKTTIGACLGEPDEVSMKILKNYVRLFDFKNRPFTTSLRVFLESFRLPGEAQKIDRILQSFSEHFYYQNKSNTPFSSADAAHVLAFACIMLNTDQHNSSIKKKMTLEEFISNSRGINDGHDLPREFLREVYASISSVEIRMSDESSLHALTEDHWDEQLRKMGIDPESGESNDMLAFPSPAKAKEFDEDVFLIAWKPMLTATCRALSAATDGDEVQSAIEGFLGIARLATVFRQCEPVDQVIIGLSSASKLCEGDLRHCLVSFGLNINSQMATVALYGIARQCGDCLRERGWEALLTCTMRLHTLKLLPSNLEQLLFGDGEELVDLDGNPLPASAVIPYWWPGYYDSSHMVGSSESPQHASTDSSPQSGNNTSKLSSVFSAFGSLFGFGGDDSSDDEMDGTSLQAPDFLVRSTPEEVEAEKLGKKCVRDCRIDEIFITDSRFLRTEAIVALIQSISKVINQLLAAPCSENSLARSSYEKDDNTYSRNNGDHETGKSRQDLETFKKAITKEDVAARECALSFCIDLMREILLRNRDRLFLLWPYCYEILEKVLSPSTEPSPSLERATVTLLRVIIRYGHREELSTEIFRCLNLFVKLDWRSFEAVAERIAAGLYHICRTHVAQIECTSSWHTLLSLLESLARCSSPANIFGFETISFLLESKDRFITSETFSLWLDAVLAYTEAPTPIALRAVECLSILAAYLQHMLSTRKDSYYETETSNLDSSESSQNDSKSKVWNEFWSPLLSAYCCLCLDDRSEVRNEAFLTFEKLLTTVQQLQHLSGKDWKCLFHDLLLPLSYDLMVQRKLIQNVASGDRLSRKVQAKVPTLVSKMFLLYHGTLSKLLSADEFEELWLKILSNLDWILKQRDDDDVLADQVHEATKNLVLVLYADGTIPPSENENSLWNKTLAIAAAVVPDIENHIKQRSRTHSMEESSKELDSKD